MSTKKPEKGLRLTLGGAPGTPHVVVGLPGFYRSDKPTPVGGPGECSLARAEEASREEGCPVEVVPLTEKQAAELREESAAIRDESRSAVVAARKSDDGSDAVKAHQEAEALTSGANTAGDTSGEKE